MQRLWFRAVPEYEELRLSHPVPKRTEGDQELIDFRTVWPMTPALAAACAEDEDLRDEEFWRDELSQWPLPDRLGLQALLVEINTTAANAELAGKVSATTR